MTAPRTWDGLGVYGGFAPLPRRKRQMAEFVLVEALASERQGRTLWFKQMTGIGPMTTALLSERAVFPSREAAEQCPAMWHALSCFEVCQCCPVCGDSGELDLGVACPLLEESGHSVPLVAVDA